MARLNILTSARDSRIHLSGLCLPKHAQCAIVHGRYSKDRKRDSQFARSAFSTYSRPKFTTRLRRQDFSRKETEWLLAHLGERVSVYSVAVSCHRINPEADSTVLAYVMKTLNDRYDYGLELFLLSIDEGITGYRDDSLEVRSTTSQPLHSCLREYFRR